MWKYAYSCADIIFPSRLDQILCHLIYNLNFYEWDLGHLHPPFDIVNGEYGHMQDKKWLKQLRFIYWNLLLV